MEPVCSSVYTAGWKTRPFQIVSTNMEREDFFFFFFFQACALSHLSQTSNQSLRGKKKYPSKPDSCLLSIEVALWSYEASGGFVFAWFIFMARQIWRLSKCQGHLSCGSSAAWAFFFWCGEKESRGPILRFMTYCVKRATPDKQVGALM